MRCSLALSLATALTGQIPNAGASPDCLSVAKDVGFSDSDLARSAHQPVVRSAAGQDGNAAFANGLIRIEVSEEALVDYLLGLKTLRGDDRTLQMGPFGTPPSLEDLAPLVFEREDIEDLKGCSVGACEMQVGDFTMELSKQIDWNARDGRAQATRVLKEGLLARVRAYEEHGSLPVYRNNDLPEPVATAFDQMLAESPEIVRQDPVLFDHLRQFPGTPLADTDERIYWAKDRARHPVVSAVHLCIHRVVTNDQTLYFGCLKHIYDSRYFIGYAEFLAFLPDLRPQRGFYFVRSVRALIDPPRGMFGGFLMERIRSRMRNALASDLGYIKERLEANPPRE